MNSFQSRLIEAAADGGLVLTANKRLARHLRAVYDRQMQQQGHKVWRTPQIVSFDGWLQRSLAELGDSWRLLAGFPALRLWERLIEEDAAGSELELLQLAATARKAQEAHQLLVAYGCDLEGGALTEDQRVFRRWQQRFRQQCRQHHWLDKAELPRLICRALAEGRLPAPEQVLLAGFDQWSPELSALQQALESVGSRLEEVLPQATAMEQAGGRAGRLPCSDPRQEVEQAARWARKLLEQGATSIGIVVPDLQGRRREIERVFRDQIDPQAALQPAGEGTAFSLSLGAPLLEQGPVHAACEILAADYLLPLDQASFLLRSPYLAGALGEADARAQLDQRLRSFRQQQIKLARLAELAAKQESTAKLAELLQHLSVAGQDRRLLLPGEWAASFAKLLQELGWPGERSLSSYDYQVLKAWRDKLLPALASLDPVSRPIDRRQALGLLRRLAGELEFQLEAPTGPVQVVGLLESAGLDFDHLWVMGLSEESLPAAPRPNPFLPIGLQLEQQMPHAGAERELEFARRVIARLQAASPDLVLSYPQRQGDCELRPSPLLRDFPEIRVELAEPQDPCRRLSDAAPELLGEEDALGPPLTAERGEGGTGILRDQALCPFRAFAHHRLRSRELEHAQPGLDPLTRGNLLHLVLENFWSEVGEQQQLLTLEAAELAELVSRRVGQALEDYFADRARPPEKLLELERARLQALVGEWLVEVEQRRPTFRVVETEQEHFEQIGPLKIRTIIDRVDRLADGSRVVLDYKTGEIKPEGLLGERLLEPQLPIYAIVESGAEADGVAFGRVRRGGCKLVGVARSDELLPKVPAVTHSKQAQVLGLSDWPELLEHWRRQLEELAGAFVAGRAEVDPVDFEQACRYCDLAGLCRIAEAEEREVQP